MSVNSDDIKAALLEVLQENRSIDNDTHATHHDFVANQIQKLENRAKMVEKFKLSFIGTMAVGFASLMVWIGKLIVDALSRGNHP